VAPLALLCAAALASRLDDPPRLALYAGSFAALLFAVFVLRPGFVVELGFRYQPDLQTEPLALSRAGGLRVSRDSADEYNLLIPFVSQLAAGQPILAGPDSPEVYFLAGSPNPTPVFFDFFHDPTEYRELMRSFLDRSPQIHVVVIKSRPQLSRYNREILESLVLPRFPHMRKFASFEVFWRQ
jgi:hypothetical protein